MIEQTVVQKAFIKIMEERIFNVAYKKAQKDELFVEAKKKRDVAFRLLSDSLTTDTQRRLLDNLESAWNFVEGLKQEYAYRQGLQDSQMIHKELAEFGISVTKESVSHE